MWMWMWMWMSMRMCYCLKNNEMMFVRKAIVNAFVSFVSASLLFLEQKRSSCTLTTNQRYEPTLLTLTLWDRLGLSWLLSLARGCFVWLGSARSVGASRILFSLRFQFLFLRFWFFHWLVWWDVVLSFLGLGRLARALSLPRIRIRDFDERRVIITAPRR